MIGVKLTSAIVSTRNGTCLPATVVSTLSDHGKCGNLSGVSDVTIGCLLGRLLCTPELGIRVEDSGDSCFCRGSRLRNSLCFRIRSVGHPWDPFLGPTPSRGSCYLRGKLCVVLGCSICPSISNVLHLCPFKISSLLLTRFATRSECVLHIPAISNLVTFYARSSTAFVAFTSSRLIETLKSGVRPLTNASHSSAS